MQAVYKYPIETTDYQWVPMPNGAEILCVQVQRGQPCLWAKVETADWVPVVKRAIIVVGTGHKFEGVGYKYIGSYKLHDGDFVGHVFEAT